MKKETLRTLRCGKCGYKTEKRFEFPAEDLDTKCPKCNELHLMSAKMRLECMEDGCKKYTIVEGDPTWSNWNFWSSKYKESVDIRNVGYVCPEHHERFEKKLAEIGKEKEV